MIPEASELYAVVWHESGRVDFEPLPALVEKNAADLEAGRKITRTLVGVEPTEIQAGEAAKHFRDVLKKLREADHV